MYVSFLRGMLKLPRGWIEVKEGDSEAVLKAENVKPHGGETNGSLVNAPLLTTPLNSQHGMV